MANKKIKQAEKKDKKIIYTSGFQTGCREILPGAPRKHAKVLHLSLSSSHYTLKFYNGRYCLEELLVNRLRSTRHNVIYYVTITRSISLSCVK